MTLSSPVVSQPLSDWTQKLHVTGALPGAIVLVRATARTRETLPHHRRWGAGQTGSTFYPGFRWSRETSSKRDKNSEPTPATGRLPRQVIQWAKASGTQTS